MNNNITIILLLVLTSVTAFFSMYYGELSFIVFLIMGLSAIKFLLVVFQFMELKKAHTAWKVGIIGFVVLFTSIVTLILT